MIGPVGDVSWAFPEPVFFGSFWELSESGQFSGAVSVAFKGFDKAVLNH